MSKRRRIDPADRPEGLTHNPFAALRPAGDAAPSGGGASDAERSMAAAAGSADPAPARTAPPGSDASRGKVVVRREKKGRGGRTVTRLSGLGLDAAALDELARRLKRALGAGASVDGEDVLVQGALVERVRAWIAAELGRESVAGN